MMRIPIFLNLLLFFALAVIPKAEAKPRTFLFALPITLGSPVKLSYNLGPAAVAVDLTSESEYELLSKKKQEEEPGSSLLVSGGEFGFMFSRFSMPKTMSGWHWGLGVGYRNMTANWLRSPREDQKDNPLDENGFMHHTLKVSGTTVTGRAGFRYVAEELGFMASLFLMIKHFQNRVRDDEEAIAEKTELSKAHYDDRISLRNRLMTQVRPGIEIGWAF